MQNLSLLSIKHDKRVLATSDNELMLDFSNRAKGKAALWSTTYCSSSLILKNQEYSYSLTFDLGNRFDQCLKIQDYQQDLFIHVLFNVDQTNGDFCLELQLENRLECTISPIFFLFEPDKQLFLSIDHNFFKSNTNPAKNLPYLNDTCYDYVVIGSSFCAVAFIERLLENNPNAKILVLEKGVKYLPKHHQHAHVAPGDVEYVPWYVSSQTTDEEYIQNVHGQIPLLGGRSTYWSGWSPTPSIQEMVEWPEKLIVSLQKTYFHLAHKFLGVIKAAKIEARHGNNRVYGAFQQSLRKRLDTANSIKSVEKVFHAPLAMGNSRLVKFSTPEKLLGMTNVTVIYDCTVEKILHHNGRRATALVTSQGQILLSNDTRLILAMSTLPATTLVLNSFQANEFPQLANVGKRFSAHFVSSIVARVPRRSLPVLKNTSDVELGAIYIRGSEDQGQYHLQLSAVSYTQCNDPKDIYSICKKYSANSIPRQCIDPSQDFIVVSCSTLGELNYRNRRNCFSLIDNRHNVSTRGTLEIHLDEQDKQLWKTMDEVTFQVMKKLSTDPNTNDLEYWHETGNIWSRNIPSMDSFRKKFLVHDTSTMWIGDSNDDDAPVSDDYRLKGVDNVYITGGALWPTGGSWNPVLTIVAMAMHLADTIQKTK